MTDNHMLHHHMQEGIKMRISRLGFLGAGVKWAQARYDGILMLGSPLLVPGLTPEIPLFHRRWLVEGGLGPRLSLGP